MSEMYFYDKSLLPAEFSYPQEYRQLVEKSDNLNLTPWWLIGKNPAFAELCFKVINDKLGGEKVLVPFAKADDNDDIACFDGNDTSGNPQIYFDTGQEDMRGINWTERYSLPSFEDWLEMARNHT